jgi:hypothetical protein
MDKGKSSSKNIGVQTQGVKFLIKKVKGGVLRGSKWRVRKWIWIEGRERGNEKEKQKESE